MAEPVQTLNDLYVPGKDVSVSQFNLAEPSKLISVAIIFIVGLFMFSKPKKNARR